MSTESGNYSSAVSERFFSVVPASGHSRRMGRPKLLLPWKGVTVIEHVVQTLLDAECSEVLVVIRSEDQLLQEAVRRTRATIVIPPVNPTDMRMSVQYGLQKLMQFCNPQPSDAWFLVPADHPTLEVEWVKTLQRVYRKHPLEIHVPVYEGRRGHPVLFPWSLAQEVTALPEDKGINALLHAHPSIVREQSFHFREILDDLDTPDDYRRLNKEHRF